ncbi:MAG TPA: hypothetical protein VFC67_18115 [Prolixibacteraceae bacterium]|nr:hypothetical protein [Prolixibacteraceae bacterium]
MKPSSKSIVFFISLIIFSSCVTSAYITDQESTERQKEMRKYRTGVNFAEVGVLFASAVGEAFTGVNIYPEPSTQSFRKMRLINESKDTLYINMVTDWLWKDSAYCDIREIVMPPLESAKVIVPLGAAYNIYFRTDYNTPDDEKVEINTAETGRIKLNPGKGKSVEISSN